MHRYLSVLFVSAALAGSVAAKADDNHHSDNRTQRYYDRDARDYHEWNEREDQAYRRYLRENRKREREFAKANRRERQDYFKWRHRHQTTTGARLVCPTLEILRTLSGPGCAKPPWVSNCAQNSGCAPANLQAGVKRPNETLPDPAFSERRIGWLSCLTES